MKTTITLTKPMILVKGCGITMNLRHLMILRAHGYKRRHIKAWRSGAVTFEELYLTIPSTTS